MRLYVPTNGDQLRLVADWTFLLCGEDIGDRNRTMLERLRVRKVMRRARRWPTLGESLLYPDWVEATLPAGTVLQVDRVYIRKFNAAATSVVDDYDSITFVVLEHPTWKREGKKKVMARFWVKLRDANTIDFEHAAPPRWSPQRQEPE
jgi:hypothetical protein